MKLISVQVCAYWFNYFPLFSVETRPHYTKPSKTKIRSALHVSYRKHKLFHTAFFLRKIGGGK